MMLSKVALVLSILVQLSASLHLEFHNIFLGSILDRDKQYMQSVIDKEWDNKEYEVKL